MIEENEQQPEIIEIISWEVPEYEKHSRTKRWYILFGAVMIAMIIYAIFSANFLFAIILIVAGFVLIINDARTPQMVTISLTTDGIFIGRKFYDFDDFRDFSIVYKPNIRVKQLYFEFKSLTKHRLSIPLLDVNPIFLRENLGQYLTEDLERTDQTASEALAKLLKL